jgi:predicted transcriptional regulator
MTSPNVYIPEDLLTQLQAKAAAEGKSADELAAEALKRYLNREWLERMGREGLERRKQYGLKTDEEVEEFVQKAIEDYRRGR